MNESDYQARIIAKVKAYLPGCVILKNDSSYLPGIPDILILYNERWAMLEIKVNGRARHQANQEYYVNHLNSLSFASFIYPEIEEAVLYDLQHAFGTIGEARLSKS
jgi:hypothetical protein